MYKIIVIAAYTACCHHTYTAIAHFVGYVYSIAANN